MPKRRWDQAMCSPRRMPWPPLGQPRPARALIHMAPAVDHECACHMYASEEVLHASCVPELFAMRKRSWYRDT